MQTIKIENGKFKGRYEVECEKIVHVQFGAHGEVRVTVGRGTSRYIAVMKELAAR